MRGIPIGVFSLLPKYDNERYSKSDDASGDGGYFGSNVVGTDGAMWRA